MRRLESEEILRSFIQRILNLIASIEIEGQSSSMSIESKFAKLPNSNLVSIIEVAERGKAQELLVIKKICAIEKAIVKGRCEVLRGFSKQRENKKNV